MGFVSCPECNNSKVIRHGTYHRKKAVIDIQRFKCKKCDCCFSWLPPFLLPHKHYSVPEIVPAIEKYVKDSKGLLAVFCDLEELPCCLETLRFWVNTFSSMASSLFKTARSILAEIKPNFKFEKDKRFFNAPSLQTHFQLHQLFILREYFVSLIEPEEFLVWLIFQSRLQTKKALPTRFEDDGKGIIRNNGSVRSP